MTSKVKSSMLDAQSYINAVSGSLSSPQSTLSGFWKLDQALTGSLHGNADTASTLLNTYNLNGTGFNGSQSITVPLNTTTTNSNGNYYIPFVSSNSNANQTTYVNGSLYYNASNGQLNVSSLVASGTISGINFASTASIGANVSITANASLSGSSSGTNTGDQNLSSYAPLASPTFTGYVTIPNTLNMSTAAGSPSISFNNGGVLTPQQTLGTYQGVGAQTSVGLVFGHASPGGTPTGATYIEIGNTATADGSNAQLWVKSDTSQIQVLSQASGNSSAAGGGSAGLYGNSTNGMFLWENTGSVIKFVIGSNLSTPQLNITNSVSTATSTTSAPVTVASGLGVNGNVYATNYYGNGSNLTGITSPVTSVNSLTGAVTIYVPNQAVDTTSNPTFNSVYAGAFYYTSDRTLKENIVSLNSGDVVDVLRPVSFTWRKTKKPTMGFIAQEVQELIPSAVSVTENGTLSIDYSNLVAHLTAKIQNQNTRIKDLESKVEFLLSKIQ